MTMVRAHRAWAVVAFLLLCPRLSVKAQEPPPADDSRLTLRTSLKTSGLLSRAPDDPVLFPERTSAISFWRLRLEPTAHLSENLTLEAAYEQRLRLSSASSGGSGIVAAGVLPPDTPAPYRIRQLDWQLSSSSSFSWRHEVDRLAMRVHRTRSDWTIGRQAVGWGRGVLFGAIDLFSPFTPLEADREWRRGVDALRADLLLSDRVGLDVVGAFGQAIDSSILAARLRGYAGTQDLEIVGGRRARDGFVGLSSSRVVGDAEIHGELGIFRTPNHFDDTEPGDHRWPVKVVVGGSYRFGLGSGLLVHTEYHYSGFGARRASDLQSLLTMQDFRARYLRGDMQVLGRHAIGALASYDFSPEIAVAAQWLQSPVDGSGLVAPSTTVTLGDRLSLLVSAYLPYGRAPRGSILRSEYGGTPLSGFLQIRIYG